jgi:hypothetical protein
MQRYLTRIGKTSSRLVVSHAVPAGSREVTVAFNFISERAVYSVNCTNYFVRLALIHLIQLNLVSMKVRVTK